MKLLILKENDYYPGGEVGYRGTKRPSPSYCEEFTEQDEINKLFFWSCESETKGYLEDITKACLLVELYKSRKKSEFFEIIEVTTNNEPPIIGNEFLGFDISSSFSDSFLYYNLNLTSPKEYLQRDKILPLLEPLLELVEKYFKAKLNKNVLFNDYDVAKFCRKCILSLQSIHGNLFEFGDLSSYEVISIYKVDLGV